ncbi:hypothetical protein NOK12_13520 [Nocardioides sp. OK12]|nr:hypothetical protein NOK12_13520 [Nocardioides sp. OK12]
MGAPSRLLQPRPWALMDTFFLSAATDMYVRRNGPDVRRRRGRLMGATDQLQPEVLPQPSQT